MSSPTLSQLPREDVDTNKTARVLANLQRVTASAEPPASLEPVVRKIEPPTAPEAAAESRLAALRPNDGRAVAEGKPRRPRGMNAETIAEKPFEVSTGRGIKMLNVRVPKDLHARLTLIATRNKLAENGAPSTITDLAIDALRELVERHEAA